MLDRASWSSNFGLACLGVGYLFNVAKAFIIIHTFYCLGSRFLAVWYSLTSKCRSCMVIYIIEQFSCTILKESRKRNMSLKVSLNGSMWNVTRQLYFSRHRM